MRFDDLKEEWDETPKKGILPLGAKMRMWEQIEKVTENKPRRKPYKWIAAACILLLMSVSGYLYVMPKASAKQLVTHTYPGDIRLLRLPDGSKVWVNQNTIIAYPEAFDGDTRSVTLNGEAYFEVARDASKPFIITSGPITTTVLGTSFRVSTYNNANPEVSVNSGKVKVEGRTNTVLLKKGDAARYENKTKTLLRHTVVPLEPKWKKVLIDVNGYTLEQVINKLSEDHAFTVTYSDNSLSALKIKGILDSRQGFEAMLQTVAFALQVKIEPQGDAMYHISR